MQTRRFRLWSACIAVSVSACAIALFALASGAVAQDGDGSPPPPMGPPVDATHYEGEFKVVAQSVEAKDPMGRTVKMSAQKRVPVIPRGYHSETLGGTFVAEWMYLEVKNRTVLFWGARILSLDVRSPLRSLGVRPGDVITRLDETPVGYGMYLRNGVMQIPELEEHYGTTDVRFIQQGVSRVRVGQIVIDHHSDDEGFDPLGP